MVQHRTSKVKTAQAKPEELFIWKAAVREGGQGEKLLAAMGVAAQEAT
jgi:hypothetical protein